ncbi:threonine-phosphate decarboxylase CobD [Spirulina subsalsa FACHB-351]|uniref:threonine-phosphate decarboxylase n=1 Tax=Spirulina subsalsa FACHB-351 TaxID=234711 RepID=A0ABT3LBY0_9CYAN|nr:threonine-phosphate decarboxylase CobD [Spirulina subsalsa]MCW6038972.1 threonine-phosphate decarboxylase CobD [Spirulina subsalsa FACHB-351]
MQRPIHGGNLVWAARVAGCPTSQLVDFSASINPLGPPESAIAAIQGGLDSLRSYPDPQYVDLRGALGQRHHLPPDWILPGNGAAELLTWVGWEFAQGGATAILTPAFQDYQRAIGAFGGVIAPCPLTLPSCDLPESFPPTARGLLLNNPHNPTGKLWSREEILPLLEQFDLVVVDEAFMDFLGPSEPASLIPCIPHYPNLVVLRSLTKFYSLPGLRLGYALAHPQRLQRWQAQRDPWPVNNLAALVGQAVLEDISFQNLTGNWLKPTRQALMEGLQKLGKFHPLPGAANFLLVQSDDSASQWQHHLLKHHRLLIRDCLSFPELGDRYFRLAVRTPAENQRLLEALEHGC